MAYNRYRRIGKKCGNGGVEILPIGEHCEQDIGDVYTIAEVVAASHWERKTIRHACESGEIVSRQAEPGGIWLLSRLSYENWNADQIFGGSIKNKRS